MGFLAWIIFGVAAAWVASKFAKSNNDIWWDMMLGTTGAVLGGFVSSLAGSPADKLTMESMLLAIVGALGFIWAGRRFQLGYRA